MRFVGSVTGASPLQAQLSVGAGAGSIAVLVGVRAATEGTSGSVSRVAISRPSTIGSGTQGSLNIRGIPTGATPLATFLTSFSSSPSLPGLSASISALPLRISWLVPKEDGVVVGGQGAAGAVLVYATTSGGATWQADVTWEEL